MPKKLRIAVWYNLPAGGAKRALRYQLKGLAERGHELEIWHPPLDDSDEMSVAPFGPQHEHPLVVERISERNYAGRALGFISEPRRNFEAMIRHSQACAAEMNAQDFDLLMAHNCWIYSSPFIGRYYKGKSLLYLQEPNRRIYEARSRLVWRAAPVLPPRTSLRKRVTRNVRDYFENRSWREQADHEYNNAASFDRILVNSRFSRDTVFRAYGLRSKFCPLGIDTDLFEHRDGPRQPYVVGIGQVDPAKNLEFLIDAVAAIPENRPNLVWIGNRAAPGYVERLRQLAARKQVDFELRLMVSDAGIVKVLNEAAVFAFASRLEPFGFVPLEANACGAPCVVIREGGMRETVVDGLNGFVVDPDPVLMGKKIQELITNPGLAKTMGQEAAAHVRATWSWDRAIDALEQNLTQVVQGE